MPAVIRSAPKGRGGRKAPARAVYSPTKLKGVGAVGLDHRAALWAAFGLVFFVLVLTLFTGVRLQHLAGRMGEAVDREFAALGFRVKSVTVVGGSALSTPAVLKAAGLTQGTPLIGLNLEDVRERVEQVGWIKSAKVMRLLPDAVAIWVVERPRLAVWQRQGVINVVDKDGQIIPEADPGAFPDLPLIVGEGANEAAAAVLPQIMARPSLYARLEALVRVDARRWDLRLKDGALIQLPAKGEDSALIQFDQLEQKARLLEIGFDRIDLRDPEMVAVRPKDAVTPSAPAPGPAGASTPAAGAGLTAAAAGTAAAE